MAHSARRQADARLYPDYQRWQKNTLQLSLDILNLGNLLNCSWGNRWIAGNNRLIEAAYGTGVIADTPAFTFRGGNQTFFIGTNLTSRWRAEVGMRYIFD